MLKRGENASGGGGLKYEKKWTNVLGSVTFTIDPNKSYLICTVFNASGTTVGISIVEKGVRTYNSPAWQVSVSVSNNTITVTDTNSSNRMGVAIFSFDGEFDPNGLIA